MCRVFPVNFSLPIFSVELRADLGEGERSLVELSFREFSLNYKKTNEFETTLQVSASSMFHYRFLYLLKDCAANNFGCLQGPLVVHGPPAIEPPTYIERLSILCLFVMSGRCPSTPSLWRTSPRIPIPSTAC